MTVEAQFQSTHSLRSATAFAVRDAAWVRVSIHALLAECDFERCIQDWLLNGFNPRTPCGVRPISTPRLPKWMLFQSTHSLRSATGYSHPSGFSG